MRTIIKNFLQGNLYIAAFIFISILTLIGVFEITEELKKEELKKIEIYAASQKLLFLQEFKPNEMRSFLFEITQNNTTIPVVLLDENDIPLLWKNYDNEIFTDSVSARKKIKELKIKYPPIEIDISGKKQFIYYEESLILRQLQYYPIVLLFFYIILLLFIIRHVQIIENTKKSNLWSGMAKETAHQLGTPLTSIAGWIELLKEDASKDEMISIREIEKDIIRLNKISFRFSKIGSEPELKQTNLIDVLQTIYDYLKRRISPNINFKLVYLKKDIQVLLDEDLFSWVVENLVKNSLDAMSNKGEIIIKVYVENNFIKISFKDTGKGIPQNKFKEIFEPGYSTKKRGWGLGLSLAKRIIKDYHNGKIYVHESEVKTGTVFVIELPLIKTNIS